MIAHPPVRSRLQAEVCFLGLPPGFPAVPLYLSHTFRSDTEQASRGKTCDLPRVDVGFIKHALQRMEDFMVTCPFVPGYATPHTRFLFVAPRFRIELPPHATSR